MATTKKRTSRLATELLEMAGDMRKVGLLSRADHEKITMRHVGAGGLPRIAPITAAQIRTMRERANVSQAVFAGYLNVSVAYISQLERGTKRPSGAALALLNVVKRKGIEGIL